MKERNKKKEREREGKKREWDTPSYLCVFPKTSLCRPLQSTSGVLVNPDVQATFQRLSEGKKEFRYIIFKIEVNNYFRWTSLCYSNPQCGWSLYDIRRRLEISFLLMLSRSLTNLPLSLIDLHAYLVTNSLVGITVRLSLNTRIKRVQIKNTKCEKRFDIEERP